MTKLNILHQLAELRKLLNLPDTRVIKKKLRICGESDWEIEDGKIQRIRIYLDWRRDGHVRLVLHELLHIYWRARLDLDKHMVYDLEEAAIKAWEAEIYEWLHAPKRERRLESWNRAIERKMR